MIKIIQYVIGSIIASVTLTSCGLLEQAQLDEQYRSDPSWIECSTSAGVAKWAYFPKAPKNYKQAIWVPTTSTYGPMQTSRMPRIFRAEGPGQIEFNKEYLSLSNVFDSDRTLLEVTGDWKDGKLVNVHSVHGTEAGNPVTYNWDAINAGLVMGAAPFVVAGKALGNAIKEGAEIQSKAIAEGKCYLCLGRGQIHCDGDGHGEIEDCNMCQGSGWRRCTACGGSGTP